MKAAQRESYFILTKVPLPGHGRASLCHFCRYAEWEGSSCGDGDCDLNCKHGIDKISEECYESWSGSDCWGFRPHSSREDCVDIVGIWLCGEAVDWDSVRRRK